MDEGYSHLGALLRQAREERHITLEHASRQLHIRARYLHALEEGKFSDLPGAAYVKGYLQAYAAYVELDKTEILRRFEQLDGILARKGFFLPQVFSKEKQAGNHVVGGALLAALLIYCLWAFVLTPGRTDISIVDNPAQPKAPISARALENVACLKPQDGLYPPCHTMTAESPVRLPLNRQMPTIMELAETADKQ